MFTLRELNTKEACLALTSCLLKENFKTCSPLLKHEAAFVLAQMNDVFKHAEKSMIDCINDPEEHPVVKHELLISLGEIVNDTKLLEHLT